MRTPVAFLLASLAAPAAAQGFRDEATGFAVNPPAPFVAQATTRRQFDVGAGISPTTGVPPIAGTGKYLCEAGFKAAPQNAGLTQAEINALSAGKEWRDIARAMFGVVFHVDAMRSARIGAIAGVEIEARPKFGPDYENARVFAAIHETPKGRVTMICSTTKAAWAKALPAFRAVRATITAPK
ncbi:MAG: hypothetical protein JNK46_20145 [Methylobacteriaceae bacterium]|nr:hypothetical protein [Methylobacteriaceae bacterium]